MRKQVLDTSSNIVKELVKALARSRVAMAGSLVTAVVLPVLVISVLLDMQGGAENPYFGFLIYMVMGPLLVAGLAAMLIGVLFFKDREAIGLFTLEYIKEQINMPGRFTRVRKLIYVSAALVALTLIIVLGVSVSGYKYTESVSFCGQFCHTVMAPEYISHQNSPHSRVSCVECHIDENAGIFTRAKVSGLRQIFATAADSFERPLKTPITSLRPSRAVCEKCHRPDMFHGDKLEVKDSYLPDQQNTHLQTVLLMKVGSGGNRTSRAQGIHWHVAADHQVYLREGAGPDEIDKVLLIDHDGRQVIFSKGDDFSYRLADQGFRLMDCLDCHNRPTHIFLTPEEAVDQKILSGLISRDLPYIKRQAVLVLKRDYPSQSEAGQAISVALESWYRENYPVLFKNRWEELSGAIRAVIQAYRENVFPEMRVGWGTYRNNIGHRRAGGCFRCHRGDHKTPDGRSIPNACDLCHVVLADRETEPVIMKLLYDHQPSGGAGAWNR